MGRYTDLTTEDLTTFQAMFIKYLRISGCSWRALARHFTRRYPAFDHGFSTQTYSDADLDTYRICYRGEEPQPNESSNQLLGMELQYLASKKLNQNEEVWEEQLQERLDRIFKATEG